MVLSADVAECLLTLLNAVVVASNRQIIKYFRGYNKPLTSPVWLTGDIHMKDKLTASEALFGFASWLTCREEKTVMSSSDDAAPIAYLVAEFCKENGLSDPRDGWENNLIHPTGECTGPAN